MKKTVGSNTGQLCVNGIVGREITRELCQLGPFVVVWQYRPPVAKLLFWLVDYRETKII